MNNMLKTKRNESKCNYNSIFNVFHALFRGQYKLMNVFGNMSCSTGKVGFFIKDYGNDIVHTQNILGKAIIW